MKNIQITVRNVDPMLKQRINKLAKLKAMSINEFVLETLRDKVGVKIQDKTASWRSYEGVMGKNGINQTVLDDFEAIDESMWAESR